MESEIGKQESVSAAVIRAVSALTGRDPGSLHPLTEVIDPEALDALFEPPSEDVYQTAASISFNYSNCRITIDNGEFLTIEPFEPVGRPSAQSHGPDRAERSRPDPNTQNTATGERSGSRVCFVCQRPIDRENMRREQGELVHPECRAELRCGIRLNPWSDRGG